MIRLSLRLINTIFRYVFRQNITAPCPVHYTSQVINGNKIKIPEGSAGRKPKKSFAQSGNCYYQAKNGIIIQSGCLWGPGVKFISASRDFCNIDGYICERSIKLGFNSLIGTNSVILPGVWLGPHTYVGAGSVVTNSFEEGWRVIAGNPAKIIWRK